MVEFRWVWRCRSSTLQIVPLPTPLPPRRPLATSGTLLQCAEWRHPARQCLWHAQVGQCGCHRLDKLLLPNLRIENGEVLARSPQHVCTRKGRLLHCWPVLAQQVEQSAHLSRGLLRLPACLQRAQGSTGACGFYRARITLWKIRFGRTLSTDAAVRRGFQRWVERHRTSCRRAEQTKLFNSAEQTPSVPDSALAASR